MASGLPDYYRIVRQNFGGARRAFGGPTLEKDKENILVEIEGKGVLYGGNLRVEGNLLYKWYVPRIYIDDVPFFQINFDILYDYSFDNSDANPFFIEKYDEQNGIYSVGISRGYTFESKVKLSIIENQSETPIVYFNLLYALI